MRVQELMLPQARQDALLQLRLQLQQESFGHEAVDAAVAAENYEIERAEEAAASFYASLRQLQQR